MSEKTNDNIKHLICVNEKTLQTNISMIRLILDCVRPTQFNVIEIVHCSVGMKIFLFIY